MRIDEEVRKCVAFIAVRPEGREPIFVGSAFWFGPAIPDQAETSRTYLVTARHVIDEIRAKTAAENTWLRLNRRDGSAEWLPTKTADWYAHPSDPSVDVAVCETGIPVGCDHLVAPYSLCLTPERILSDEVGPGDEVSIVGLFKHHFGEERNVPIVRTGNLAITDEEKIDSPGFGRRDAYLIEARSIGGLSGSPVFLNLGTSRVVSGQLRRASGPIRPLMGLISGHYDVERSEIDAVKREPAEQKPDVVNTGIAIVVPIRQVREVIERYERGSHPRRVVTANTPTANSPYQPPT